MKLPPLQNKQVGVLQMAFQDFQETAPLDLDHHCCGFKSHLGQSNSFSLSLCGPVSLPRGNAQMW